MSDDRGAKGRSYHQQVAELVATGVPVGRATEEVARHTRTGKSNIANAYYRIEREQRPPKDRVLEVPEDLEEIHTRYEQAIAEIQECAALYMAWVQVQSEKVGDEILSRVQRAIEEQPA